MEYTLDDIDRAILYFLSEDARGNSATDIAEHVDVSAQTVRNRIDRLESANVIKGYHAHIDFERAEDALTNLFTCTTPTKDRETLARKALQIPGVVTVREIMTGRADLRITAVAKSTDELAQIARAITDLGIDIEEEDLVRREHVSPYHRYRPGADRPGPTITDFLSITGDAEVVEFTVTERMPITGATLREANEDGLLDDDTLVVAIERDDAVLTPRGETAIETGDQVSVLARHGVDANLQRAFSEGS